MTREEFMSDMNGVIKNVKDEAKQELLSLYTAKSPRDIFYHGYKYHNTKMNITLNNVKIVDKDCEAAKKYPELYALNPYLVDRKSCELNHKEFPDFDDELLQKIENHVKELEATFISMQGDKRAFFNYYSDVESSADVMENLEKINAGKSIYKPEDVERYKSIYKPRELSARYLIIVDRWFSGYFSDDGGENNLAMIEFLKDLEKQKAKKQEIECERD